MDAILVVYIVLAFYMRASSIAHHPVGPAVRGGGGADQLYLVAPLTVYALSA